MAHAPSRFGLPGFAAYLWAENFGAALASGAGTHAAPEVALARAITEAAQSRLSFIAGGRDDLGAHLYPVPGQPGRRPIPEGPAEDWARFVGGPAWPCRTDEDDAGLAARLIAEVTGAEPMIVTLADRPEMAVVKAVCPGLAFSREHIPRRREAA